MLLGKIQRHHPQRSLCIQLGQIVNMDHGQGKARDKLGPSVEMFRFKSEEHFRNPYEEHFVRKSGTTELLHAGETPEQLYGGAVPHRVHEI